VQTNDEWLGDGWIDQSKKDFLSILYLVSPLGLCIYSNDLCIIMLLVYVYAQMLYYFS
jgi:hypothetical protein